jgi:hypothetical protein
MSIFRRSSGDAPNTTTAPSPAGPEGGPTAPGVVPPPAAPVYTMRPPEASPRAEGGADSSVTERMRAAREQQESAAARVRLAVQGRTAAPAAARRMQRPAPVHHAAPVTPHALPPFNPSDASACAQAGLLGLAWRWQEAGAPIRAIHTYVELLQRYPDTPAAEAAVADLVELSRKLTAEGQFHTALAIYDHLEHLA